MKIKTKELKELKELRQLKSGSDLWYRPSQVFVHLINQELKRRKKMKTYKVCPTADAYIKNLRENSLEVGFTLGGKDYKGKVYQI